jgi:DNA-binding transcriptional MerR regulator
MTRLYFRVNVVCELLELPRPRLRRYEREGLLMPSGEPEVPGGPRRYTDADVRRIRKLRRLERDLGLNMTGVHVVINLLDQLEDMRRQLDERAGDAHVLGDGEVLVPPVVPTRPEPHGGEYFGASDKEGGHP